jgi:hypothetical protein
MIYPFSAFDSWPKWQRAELFISQMSELCFFKVMARSGLRPPCIRLIWGGAIEFPEQRALQGKHASAADGWRFVLTGDPIAVRMERTFVRIFFDWLN